MAQSSLTELKNQLFIARDISYINNIDFSNLLTQSETAHRLLQGLITKSKSFIN